MSERDRPYAYHDDHLERGEGAAARGQRSFPREEPRGQIFQPREDERPLQGRYGESDRFFGFEDDPGETPWQAVRDAGREVVQAAKRIFRGPKGYVRSDERIREDVSDRFAEQDELDPSDIEVSVASGEVTLTGFVQDRHEKFRAEDLADSVLGVRDVQNKLRIRPERGAHVGAAAALPATDAPTDARTSSSGERSAEP